MYLELFGRQIPLYGVFFFAGIFVAGLIAVLICKYKQVSKFDMVSSGVYTMIGAMIGSKLLFLIVSWKDIMELKTANNIPMSDILMAVIKGGFVFYGGLIGGALGLIIYTVQYKMKLSDLIDIYAVVLPLGHALGRVGCYFGGCCYGIPHDGAFSVTYTQTAGMTPLGVPLLAVQIIEALVLYCLFWILLGVFMLHSEKTYLCVKIYAVAYSVIRFVLEFFRGDKERGGFLFLSTSQWISILIFFIFIAKIIYDVLKHKTRREKRVDIC